MSMNVLLLLYMLFSVFGEIVMIDEMLIIVLWLCVMKLGIVV